MPVFDDRIKYIDDTLNSLDEQLKQVQSDLYNYILEQYIIQFTVTGGRLDFSKANLAALNYINEIVNELNNLTSPVAESMGNSLLQLSEFSNSYFEEMGMKVKGISKQVDALYKAMGVNKEGVIIPDGYLDRILTNINETLRTDIADYVTNSVAGKKTLTDFRQGFKELIEGNNETDGKLLQYYNNNVYDVWSRTARLTDSYYAQQLDLKWFVYSGGLIKTSRLFCQHKNQQIFTVEMADKLWPEDPFLIDQKHPESYNPIVDMGKMNCRHIARFIPNETAQEYLQEDPSRLGDLVNNKELYKQYYSKEK